MKIVDVARRDKTKNFQAFGPVLAAQANNALKLIAQDKVREIYSLSNDQGAVLEVKDEAEARSLLADMPMAKAGLVEFDVYATKPYRGFVELIKGQT